MKAKDIREAIDEVKPIAARNHKFMMQAIEFLESAIKKNQLQGKEYVCYNIFDMQEYVQVLKQVDEDNLINLLALEKIPLINAVDLLTDEEKIEYKKAIKNK